MKILIVSVLLLFISVTARAAERQSLVGYIETRMFRVDDERSGTAGGAAWRLRPSYRARLGELRFHFEGDCAVRSGYVERVAGSERESELARAYVDWSRGGWDLRFGKQSIHWGSAHIWNPTNPFPEVFIADPWAERRGLTALRFDYLLNEEDDRSLTVVSLVDDDDTELDRRHVIRFGRRIVATDFALSFGYDDKFDASWVGLNLRGEKTVGWWLEAACRDGGPALSSWWEAVVGVDYSFDVKQGLLVALQFYRNTNQLLTIPSAGNALALGTAQSTVGRNHSSLTMTLTHDEDLSTALTVLRNHDDDSMLLVPQLTLKLSGTDELIVGGRLGVNGPGAYDPSGRLDPFGLAPERSWYLWFRRFF